MADVLLTRELVFEEMLKRNYVVFEQGDYNLNLIGLRKIPGQSNKFDDLYTISYKIKGEWQFKVFPFTSDPGIYWLQNPSRSEGAAVLCPGQYRGCWHVGVHKGEYPALVQWKSPFKVWRDKDKDGKVEYGGQIYTDSAGINNHHAGDLSVDVNKWSAGCQVFANLKDWNEFWSLVTTAASVWGFSFTYTLLEYPFK